VRSLPASAPPTRQRLATCTAADLTLEQAQTDGAGGKAFVFVSVRNTSSTHCQLSGRPGLRQGDGAVATSRGRVFSPGNSTSPARLAPGMVGRLTLTADNQRCRDDPGATYTHYRHLTLTWGEDQALYLDDATGPAELDSCAETIHVTRWSTSGA
jgi:hypothetical protein